MTIIGIKSGIASQPAGRYKVTFCLPAFLIIAAMD